MDHINAPTALKQSVVHACRVSRQEAESEGPINVRLYTFRMFIWWGRLFIFANGLTEKEPNEDGRCHPYFHINCMKCRAYQSKDVIAILRQGWLHIVRPPLTPKCNEESDYWRRADLTAWAYNMTIVCSTWPLSSKSWHIVSRPQYIVECPFWQWRACLTLVPSLDNKSLLSQYAGSRYRHLACWQHVRPARKFLKSSASC